MYNSVRTNRVLMASVWTPLIIQLRAICDTHLDTFLSACTTLADSQTNNTASAAHQSQPHDQGAAVRPYGSEVAAKRVSAARKAHNTKYTQRQS